MFLPHPRVKLSIVGSLRDREVACSVSDRQGSNFESCVWRTVSSHSSPHPQEVLLAKFSLYVHRGGLNPDSFHFGFNLNSTRSKWSPGHIERGDTMIFLWKTQVGSARLKPGTPEYWRERQTLYQCTRINVPWISSKANTKYCRTNVGPPFTTLAQHWTSICAMSRICWMHNKSQF